MSFCIYMTRYKLCKAVSNSVIVQIGYACSGGISGACLHGRVHTTALGPEGNRVPVHTCSSRSGTSRPPRNVIAVERFRNGSGWLCGMNAQPDAFRSRLIYFDGYLDFGTRVEKIWHMCRIRTQLKNTQFSYFRN